MGLASAFLHADDGPGRHPSAFLPSVESPRLVPLPSSGGAHSPFTQLETPPGHSNHMTVFVFPQPTRGVAYPIRVRPSAPLHLTSLTPCPTVGDLLIGLAPPTFFGLAAIFFIALVRKERRIVGPSKERVLFFFFFGLSDNRKDALPPA